MEFSFCGKCSNTLSSAAEFLPELTLQPRLDQHLRSSHHSDTAVRCPKTVPHTAQGGCQPPAALDDLDLWTLQLLHSDTGCI